MTWAQGLGKNWSGSCLSPFLSLPFLPQNHTCEWLKFVCVWGYTQLKNLFQKLNSIMFILNYIIINHTQTKYKQTIVCARALFFCHPSAHSSAMMLSFARWVSEWAKADHLIIQMSTTFFFSCSLIIVVWFHNAYCKNAEEEALLSSFVIQRQFRRRRRLFFSLSRLWEISVFSKIEPSSLLR